MMTNKKRYQKKRIFLKKAAAILLAVCMSSAYIPSIEAADQQARAISLGANLTSEQQSAVLQMFGLEEADLATYPVIYITNETEHEYLDEYLPYEVIGNESYSSSMVTMREKGYGIQVHTSNINYCTVEMYQNALATAGVENADVVVVSPISVTGTAALVGIMQAYSQITGTALTAENVDAANNELVTTGLLAESIENSEQAADLVAALKAIVANGDVKDAVIADAEADGSAGRNTDSQSGTIGSAVRELISGEETADSGQTDIKDSEKNEQPNGSITADQIDMDELDNIIDRTASELNITLSDSDRELLEQLMIKFLNTDLDIEKLQTQASHIYDTLKEKGINMELAKDDAMNIFEKLMQFLQSIQNFFRRS